MMNFMLLSVLALLGNVLFFIYTSHKVTIYTSIAA